MDDFVKVANGEDISSGEMSLIELQGKRILLANVEGTYYAVDEACTHSDCPLSEGALEGAVVSCPCHGSQFDLRTGIVVSPPAVESLVWYQVRIDNGNILIGPEG